VLFVRAPGIAWRRHEQGLLHCLPVAKRAVPAFLLPRDIHMPQPLPIMPGPSPQANARARWHAEGSSRPPRRGAAAEAGDAAWSHHEAFAQLAGRVECLSARIEATRSALGGLGLFEGVADALEGLKTGIARLRRAWESDEPWPDRLPPGPPRPVAAVAPAIKTETDPWDAETAEALTRICEIAALEDRQRPWGRFAGLAPPTGKAAEPPPASGLDARLADLADRLQQALPGLDPAQWLAPLDQRVRQLEQAVAAAPKGAMPAPGPESLGAVEALIRDLAVQVEHTRAELGRLDAMDEHLGDMIAQLKGLAATAKATALAPARDPLQRLEGLLKASLAARRQDARAAVGVLKSIHHAVGQIADRVEALRPGEREAGPAGHTDPDADRDLLLKAYREGARALGETLPDTAYEPLDGAAAGRAPARYDWSASTWHWHAKD